MTSRVDYNLFPRMSTREDIWALKVSGVERKLVYRTRRYRLIESPVELEELRQSGADVSHFRRKDSSGNIQVAYYELEDVENKSLEDKYLEIQKILDEEHDGTGLTLREKIEKDWDIHAHKTTKSSLGDMGSKILSSMAEYYVGGEFSESEVKRKERNIRRNEVVSFDVIFDVDNGIIMEDPSEMNATLEKMSQDERENYHEEVSAKWLQSKTKKMNELFSHSGESHYPKTTKLVGWGDKEYRVSPEYQHNIERLIDPKRQYHSEWCIVDTENNFKIKFDSNKIYNIDKSVTQYEVEKMQRVVDRYDMVSILVMEQDGVRYYFDENIDRVQNDKIKMA